MSSVDEFLEHYGVKGMKWGIRRSREQLARAAGRSKKEEKIRAQRQSLSDRRRRLSDNDLKSAVERLSAEKKLKNLVNEDLRPGRTAATRILGSSGEKVLRTVAAGAGIYVVKTVVEKKFGEEIGGFVSRGGAKKK